MDGEAVSTAASLFYFDAGGDGEAGDGEAHQLSLAAAEAAYGVAHEEDFGEVLRPKAGSAEALAGAILAADGSTVARLDSEVGGATV
jgi:hypothetical protein